MQSLAACIGESSTDYPPLQPQPQANGNRIINSDEGEAGSTKVEKLEKQYKTLENEMDSVKEKIVTIISEKDKLLCDNKSLRAQLEETISQDKPSSLNKVCDADTQTSDDVEQMDFVVSASNSTEMEDSLKAQISGLQSELELNQANHKKENQENQKKCLNLESSLELLQVEYEKCEDYWHGKLQEERDTYDQLALKIREYEEMFLQQTESNIDKLAPIEERASLEQQVNDYLEECVGLRNELNSVKLEQESEIESYHRKWEVCLL